jgi:phenylacetate-CoA ligase
MWCGYKLGDPHAYLYGSFNDWEKDITFRSRLQHFMMKSFVLNVYQNLTEENMLWFINKMKERDTKYLIGYASALYALAEFIEQKGIDISMYIRLMGIVSTAEYLYDEYRKLIEKNFRCPVFNRYGCREVGNIAHECQGHSGLHINWQNIIIELFDGQRCYLPYEGDHAEGEIIITCLNNFGMPLIRYRTGDIGEFLDSKCQCGLNSPLLKIKAGRVSDQFYTKKGEIILGCNFSRLAFSFKGIKQAQFVQNSYVDFTINIVRSSEGIDQDLRLIESKFKEWFGSDIIIHYNFVEKIERELSGKYRYSKSFVNNTFKYNENTSC